MVNHISTILIYKCDEKRGSAGGGKGVRSVSVC